MKKKMRIIFLMKMESVKENQETKNPLQRKKEKE
jgi:hypothetical protein